MFRIPKTLLSAVLVLTGVGCAHHPDSYFIHNESFVLDQGSLVHATDVNEGIHVHVLSQSYKDGKWRADQDRSLVDLANLANISPESLATSAIGFVYDRVVEHVQNEAEKYSAKYDTAYTGSNFYHLHANYYDENGDSYQRPPNGPQENDTRVVVVYAMPLKEFVVKRMASSSKEGDGIEVFKLKGEFQFTPLKDFFRIVPKELTVIATKAKVATGNANLLKFFGETKDFADEFDMNVKVVLNHSFEGKDGKKVSEKVGEIEMPLKDIKLKRLSEVHGRIHSMEKFTPLDKFATGFIAPPAFSRELLIDLINKGEVEFDDYGNPTGSVTDIGNIVLTIAVEETNELGDVLTQFADKMKESKDSNISLILGDQGTDNP